MGEKKEVLSTALGHLRTKRVIAGRKGSFQDEKGHRRTKRVISGRKGSSQDEKGHFRTKRVIAGRTFIAGRSGIRENAAKQFRKAEL